MKDMVNMKMEESERDEYPTTALAESPEYPYGLCLTLDDDSIEKLGLSMLPAAGQEVMLMAKATVKSTSVHDSEGEKHKSISLQITDLALGSPEEKKKPEESLYGEVQTAMKPPTGTKPVMTSGYF